MEKRFVLWAFTSLVLGCAAAVATIEVLPPAVFQTVPVYGAGWLGAAIISVLAAWAFGLLQRAGALWLPVVVTACLISLVSSNPVLLMFVGIFECAVGSRFGQHCVFL